MEIGFISDIHGNAIALKAVLADMQSVDEIVCLGDVIGYGPRPAACVELVRNHASTVLQGNHEMFLSQPERCAGNRLAFAGINHAWDELSEDQKNWAASLKKQTRLSDGDVWIAHGHPDSQTPFKPVTEENVHDLAPYLRETEAEVLAIGHVHVPFVFGLGRRGGEITAHLL